MNIHARIGDNRTFGLKQAVLLYQEGSRAFATLHEVNYLPDKAPYLCAGQSVTAGFLETLAKGLGASMGAEVLPEHVLARTPELIAWWSRAQPRLMFFGDGNAEAKKLDGKMYPHPALVFMIHGRELFVRPRRRLPASGRYASEKRSLLEHRRARTSLSGQYASSGRDRRRLPVRLGKRVFCQRIYPSQRRCPTDDSSRRLSWLVVRFGRTEAQFPCEVSGCQQANTSGIRAENSHKLNGARNMATQKGRPPIVPG